MILSNEQIQRLQELKTIRDQAYFKIRSILTDHEFQLFTSRQSAFIMADIAKEKASEFLKESNASFNGDSYSIEYGIVNLSRNSKQKAFIWERKNPNYKYQLSMTKTDIITDIFKTINDKILLVRFTKQLGRQDHIFFYLSKHK